MKKMLCLLLATIMLLGLCACGKNNESTSNTDNTENSISDVENITEIKYPDDMRKNGEYPDDIKDLTDEEINFHNKLIFDAIQTLDISILERYTDEKSADAVEALKNIKNDKTYRALFEKTISDIRYVPSCNYMLGKSILYTFCKWYGDCEANGNCPVDDIQKLSNNQVDEIYETYYKDAPYIPVPFNSYRVYSRIVDGKVIYDIDGILSQFGYNSIASFNPKETETSNGYPQLILYNYSNLNFDTILQEGLCPKYKEVMTKDLDKMVEIVNKTTIPNDSFYKKYYETYYKDKTIRDNIQTWINENVEMLRGPHIVCFFIKPTLENSFPYYDFTEKEINEMKDLKLATQTSVGDFEKEFGRWNGYYDILLAMKDAGVIELK